MPRQRVVQVLDQLIACDGTPKQIIVDNGPEFAGRVLETWAYAQQVTLDFIELDQPAQNGYLELLPRQVPR